MTKSQSILFCVFSYNRPQFLKNLITSIERFYPDREVAVFDDNSDDPRLLALYDELSHKQGYSIRKAKNADSAGKHGELYGMMNQALDYCRQRGFTYAFFLQDDMQFVRTSDLWSQCESAFAKWGNALMFSPLFMQKIYLPKINSFIEQCDGDFLIKEFGVADVGIIDLGRATRAGLQFDERGERYNGQVYYDAGHVAVLSKAPCLAWVPWAIAFRKKRKEGRFVYKKAGPFIKPLGEAALQKLENNTDIPFLEDFTRTSRRLPKPYFYKAFNLREILVSYIKYIKHKRLG